MEPLSPFVVPSQLRKDKTIRDELCAVREELAALRKEVHENRARLVEVCALLKHSTLGVNSKMNSQGLKSTSVPARSHNMELKLKEATGKALSSEAEKLKDTVNETGRLSLKPPGQPYDEEMHTHHELLNSDVQKNHTDTKSRNKKFCGILTPGLFKKSGRSMKFTVVYASGINHNENILISNCTFLMRLCGAIVATYTEDKVPPSEGQTYLLYRTDWLRIEESDLIQLRRRIKCDILSINYAWHSILSAKLLDKSLYRLCEKWATSALSLLNKKLDLNKVPQEKKSGIFLNGAQVVAIQDLINASDSLIRNTFTWHQGKCAEFLLLEVNKVLEESSIRKSLTTLIELSGGRVLDETCGNKRLDGYEIPILVGSSAPQTIRSSKIVVGTRKLECEIFTENFIIASVFSQHSLQGTLNGDLQNESFGINWDLASKYLHSSRLAPHVAPQDHKIVGVLRGQVTWAALRVEARQRKWHTNECIAGNVGCFGCLDDEGESQCGSLPNRENGGRSIFFPSWTQSTKEDEWAREALAKALDQMRSDMKKDGRDNKDIAIAFCKKFQQNQVNTVVKKLNILDKKQTTELQELRRKRELDTVRQQVYRKRKINEQVNS